MPIWLMRRAYQRDPRRAFLHGMEGCAMAIPSRRSWAHTNQDRAFQHLNRDLKTVELVQRGRMILDVAVADLAVAEDYLGSFHETTWYFCNALAEAKRSWDRLRAEYGTAALKTALAEPPRTILELGQGIDRRSPIVLITIGGKTYKL